MSEVVSKFFDVAERPPRGGWLVMIEGVEYYAQSESALVEKIRQEWRNNNRSFTTLDIERAIWAYFRAREPGRSTVDVPIRNIRSADGSNPFDWGHMEGPKLWKLLHTHAALLISQGGQLDEMTERRFLEGFRQLIRCDDCRIHWNMELGKLPPVLTNPTAFFYWTVAIHNAVNNRLGKPLMSNEDAAALYL